MRDTYYARSENDRGETETVPAHLKNVGALCALFLRPVGLEQLGRILGELHDFGKLSDLFQEVLEHLRTGVNHALPGAALALSLYQKCRRLVSVLEIVIACHHGELVGNVDSIVKRTLCGTDEPLDAENRRISLYGPEALQEAAAIWKKDFQAIRITEAPPDFAEEEDPHLARMLFIRILYSALIDADWSSAACHFDPDYLELHTGPPLQAREALQQLLMIRQEKQRASTSSPRLNRLRDQLFEDCLRAGGEAPGFFTLTAPTGLGKTLSLFAFAASHSLTHGKRRIILVLPYLSIIEQNSAVYQRLVPDLLELHSNAVCEGKAERLSERWDAPCIVTTNVSFFEPLFSAGGGNCRHLHQFSNSVIVLDEAQSLPPHLLDATLRTLKLLCKNYKCTVLLSTATQPSFQYRPGMDWNPREIAPDPGALFASVRRVTWDWRLEGSTSFSSLAEELAENAQCCAIVNLKRHARMLYDAVCARCAPDTVFFLTADLCPAHRSRVLEQVKNRLANGQPCRLVATQCVEAGVDLDFPVLYRALAPLESLIQAAGRCNRNGDRPDGRMTVFLPEGDRLYPSNDYGRGAQCVLSLRARHPIDCSNPAHIEEYYELLYAESDGDCDALRRGIEMENFRQVEDAYRMISRKGVPVIVPYQQEWALWSSLREQYDRAGISEALLRKAGPITVQCFDRAWAQRHCEQMQVYDREAKAWVPANVFLLGIPELYDESKGLCMDNDAILIG